jgi:signal transduction histidine kinase
MRLPLDSASARLALAVAAAFLAAWVLLAGGVYLAVSASMDRDAREVVRADANDLLDLYRQSGAPGVQREIHDRLARSDDPDAFYALFPQRKPGAGSVHGPGAAWVIFRDRSVQDAPRSIAWVRTLPDGATLVTGLRMRSEDGFLRLMLQAAMAALLVAAIVGGAIGVSTSRWVGARLRGLDETAVRVGAGELGLRARSDGSGDPFDLLARRFNAMLDRIEALLDGVRHATDHIAHDLRTPLTRLRNRLDAMRSGADAPGLDAAIAETDQLLQSFGALLRLSRIESQAPASDLPVVDLQPMVRDALDLYAPAAGELGLRLVDDSEPATLRADPDQLFQMIVNLLDNALKYASGGGAAVVRVRGGRAHVVLEIADRGPGIPDGDRERAFDRFERLDPQRTEPGTGLGLSLVRAIVQRHRGTVQLLDNRPGLRVRIVLPTGDA